MRKATWSRWVKDGTNHSEATAGFLSMFKAEDEFLPLGIFCNLSSTNEFIQMLFTSVYSVTTNFANLGSRFA